MLRLGVLAAVGLLSGCSFLYDSEKLPVQQVDAPIDAPLNLCEPTIESVSPPVLHEGVGEGGGRPTVLVVKGTSISRDATITVTPVDTAARAELALLGAPAISSGGAYLATQVVARVDPMLNAGTSTPLKVEISQFCAASNAMVSASATDLLQLRGYAELTTQAINPAAPNVYSMIDISTARTFTGNSPVILRSNSSLEVSVPLSVNAPASGPNPGPGGQAGGGRGAAGGGPGGGGGGPSNGGNGGGAGYRVMADGSLGGKMAGDPLVTSYADNKGSGGGGGYGLLVLGGGAGGGGGGTIELSARGTLAIAGVTANGGGGLEGNGTAGGGGSGGTIVLRGSAVTTTGALEVSGGPSAGNRGAPGRIRVDTRELSAELRAVAGRGGTFSESPFWVVNEDQVSFTLFGTAGTKVDVRVIDEMGLAVGSVTSVDFQGVDSAPVRATLGYGYNLICALPAGSSVSMTESTNCVEVAYIRP
jgi:hypothetical protein